MCGVRWRLRGEWGWRVMGSVTRVRRQQLEFAGGGGTDSITCMNP